MWKHQKCNIATCNIATIRFSTSMRERLCLRLKDK